MKDLSEQSPHLPAAIITSWQSIQLPVSILITFLIYLVIMLMLSKTVSNLCNRWGENLKYYSKINPKWLFLKQVSLTPYDISYDADEYLKNSVISEQHKNRIKEQIYCIRDRAITSLRIARDLYYWMVIFSVTLCISTIVAGIFAYPIIQTGWDKADNSQKIVFLISLGISIFSASFNSVYQLQRNAEKFMSVYQKYVNLEEFMFTSLTIKKIPNKTIEQAYEFSEELIMKVDRILETYSLNIEFNLQSTPSLSDILKYIETKPHQ